jgi:YVTN family beta-propeller protein
MRILKNPSSLVFLRTKLRAGKVFSIAAANLAFAISAIPAHAQTLTTTVAVGALPVAMAANPVTNKIYVANEGSVSTGGSITVIDGATNSTTAVNFGASPSKTPGPTAIAVNPATNKLYVAIYGSNEVLVVDGATNATSIVPAGTNPIAVAVNPVTNKIYVANFNGANVTVIDGTTNTTTTVSAGTNPRAVAVNPVTNTVYVANQSSNNVTVIDGASNKRRPYPPEPSLWR